MRKERNISLENDLMTIGQDPMDEPDSSTTIELQKVVKETERKMLKPPAPPLSAEKNTADKPTEATGKKIDKPADRKPTPTKNKPTSKPEPKTYKPTSKPAKNVKPEPLPQNPYAPVKYDCNGKWRQLLAGIAVIGLIVTVVALFLGVKTYWRLAVIGILVAFLMLPLYGWFDELERDMAVKAVEEEYKIRILQTAGGGNLADVRFSYQQNPTVKAGIVSYSHGLAWLRNANGSKIIGRDKPLE